MQSSAAVTALVLASVLLLASTSARPITIAAGPSSSTLDPRFQMASEGEDCQAFCATRDLKDAYFQPFSAHGFVAATSVCAADVEGQGYLPGYQFRGTPECIVAFEGEVVNTTDYACLCLNNATETQGEMRGDGMDCNNVCGPTTAAADSTITAEYGKPQGGVSADSVAPAYACVPYDDTGSFTFSAFGYTNGTDTTCNTVNDDMAVSIDTYSCFCIFDKAASSSNAAASSVSTQSIP